MKSILLINGGVLFLTIYADQMFLENFIMNYIILYAVSKFSDKPGKWYRLALSATIGAIYVISSYVFGFYDKQLVGAKLLLAVVMIFTAFDIKNVKDFLKKFLFFLGITFLIGGVSLGLAFLTNLSMIQEGGILYVEEFPVLMLAIGGVVGTIIIKWMCVFLKNKVNTENFLYSIEIKIFDKKILTTVFLDSGHNVYERFTGYPVVIIENRLLEELVPNEILHKVKQSDFDFEDKWKRKLRVIPISTVSNKDEVLIGFRVDECVIHTSSENMYIRNLIVAGCDRKLDNNDKYFALMGNILDSNVTN